MDKIFLVKTLVLAKFRISHFLRTYSAPSTRMLSGFTWIWTLDLNVIVRYAL